MGCSLSTSNKQGKRKNAYLVGDDANAPATAPETQQAPAQPVLSPAVKKAKTEATAKPTGHIKAGVVPAVKPKLDPKDFMFTNLKGETRVKLPGSINGQQFIIDACEDCDLYVMDHCAMVTVDDCKNCRIFIGPTDSSIFIRTSSNCKCVFLCRQLRTRECKNCDIALLCRTRPIIESSTAMAFACAALPYAGLAAQLAACKLSPLHNFWGHIFDFTTAADKQASNWRLLPAGTTATSVVGVALPPEAAALVEAARTLPAECAAAVCTWGERPLPADAAAPLFLLFPPGQALAVAELVVTQKLGDDAAEGRPLLVRTNEAAVSGEVVKQMAAAAGWASTNTKGLSAGTGKPAIGLELAGGGKEQREGLVEAAKKLGALVSHDDAAAKLFRYLGVDG